MKRVLQVFPLSCCLFSLLLYSACRPAQESAVDPRIAEILQAISADSLQQNLSALVGFHTRHTLSDTLSESRGIGAARHWLAEKFEQYGRGRLRVEYHAFDTEIYGQPAHLKNVVAILPGTNPTGEERYLIVGAHYDSRNLDNRDPVGFAPGANDDGSGTVALLELARVLSPYDFEATLAFVEFAGEEQGLFGSGAFVEWWIESGRPVEAMLTNDVIGNILGEEGGVDSTRARVFSADPDHAPPRQLARFVHSTATRYLPDFRVEMVFRPDRLGRGGDHIPFYKAGVASVRLSESLENYSHQHSDQDLPEFVSPTYLAQVTRVNAAALAALGWAPAPPEGLALDRERGENRWQLSWSPNTESDLDGYVVTLRKTTSPTYDRFVSVGTATEYLLEDVNVDDYYVGLMAVDRESHRSLVSTFHREWSRWW